MLSREWHNENFKTKTGTGPAINNSNSSSTMALQWQQGTMHHGSTATIVTAATIITQGLVEIKTTAPKAL
jgi:hypothetical protein